MEIITPGSILIFIVLMGLVILYIVATTEKSVPKQRTTTNKNRSGSINGKDPQGTSLAVVQVLETLLIMTDSKNIDTIIGRSEFLEERLHALRQASTSKRYATDVQYGLDQYKSTYYNRDIFDWQVAVIIKPYEFDSQRYFAKCLYQGFLKHYDDQIKQINNLKRESAILNRFKKLDEKFNEFMTHFDKDWDTEGANNFKIEKKTELDSLRDEIRSHIK